MDMHTHTRNCCQRLAPSALLYSLRCFFGGNIKWHEFATSLLSTKIAATPSTAKITTA